MTDYNETQNRAPVGQLNDRRGLAKLIIFSILTLGIYSLVFYSGISSDINVVASRYDGRKTMHYCLLFFVISPITFGIGALVWNHRLANRVGNELSRRGLSTRLSAADFWLWNILGALIVVGPLVYVHKLAKAMNALASDYNARG